MKSVFIKQDVAALNERIEQLQPTMKPLWGKMHPAQMLAHCNVAYELIYEDKHEKPKGFKKWLLKTLVKKIVVSDKPYKQNSRTAPEFMVENDKDFAEEKKRIQDFMQQTLDLGEAHFEGKESHSFGKLTAAEWNNMLYKHLNHHLNQFGV